MKLSEAWLREWVNPDLSIKALSDKLTMGGFEVDDIAPVSEKFTGIVIGQVLKVEKHPEAERLHVCEVSVGGKNHLRIVCGASNVVAGMKVPAAMIDAMLPNQTKTAGQAAGVDSLYVVLSQ